VGDFLGELPVVVRVIERLVVGTLAGARDLVQAGGVGCHGDDVSGHQRRSGWVWSAVVLSMANTLSELCLRVGTVYPRNPVF
jgi:hypothetical protein